MSVKRRGFLAMLGAAVGAPLMPGVGAAAPSRAAFDVAVAHAQRFPVVSAAGLAKHGKLSLTQAEAMIRRLALEGKVKLVGPSRSGALRAASRILTHDPWGMGRTAQAHRTATRAKQAEQQSAKAAPEAKAQPVPLWLAHVQDICRARGMVLSERCFA